MKKNQRSLLTKALLTFALVFTMTLLCGTQAKAAAAPEQVTDIKQTRAGNNSVSVEWKPLLYNDVYYDVWVATSANGKYVHMATSAGKGAVVEGLRTGTSYWLKVQAYIDGYDNKIYGKMSQPIEVVTVPSSDVKTIKHIKSTYTSIRVNWTAVPGANTYRVEYGKNGSDKKRTVYTSGTSVELKKLSKDSYYWVEVDVGRKTANGTFEEYDTYGTRKYSIPVRPSFVKDVEVPYYWEKSAEMEAKCKDNPVADYYEWQFYTAYKSRDSKVAVETGDTFRNIIKPVLKKHYFFKVRVRAYCKDSNGNKYYSPYSSWKYVCQQPDVKIKNTSKGQKVSWDTIKGADRYVLYMSTKEKSGYKKVATTKKTSTVVKKFNKKKLKSGKKYYYYVVAYKKDGKKYYSGEAGNAKERWGLKYKK